MVKNFTGALVGAILATSAGMMTVVGNTGTATAGIFTYDFTSSTFRSGTHGRNHSYTPDLRHPDINKGVKLKIFGGTLKCYGHSFHDPCYGDYPKFHDKKVNVNGEGIGVYAPFFIFGDSRETDGFLHPESLRLMFDFSMSNATKATLKSLEFDIDSFRFHGKRFRDPDDELELFVDGKDIDLTAMLGGSNLIGNKHTSYRRTCDYQGDFDNCVVDLYGLGLTGTMFDIVAEDFSDDFRLVRATFWIPEPGTLAVFGVGLAGLGLARRKRLI